MWEPWEWERKLISLWRKGQFDPFICILEFSDKRLSREAYILKSAEKERFGLLVQTLALIHTSLNFAGGGVYYRVPVAHNRYKPSHGPEGKTKAGPNMDQIIIGWHHTLLYLSSLWQATQITPCHRCNISWVLVHTISLQANVWHLALKCE